MSETRRQDLVVVKVGGSLYDLPDLGPKLRAWLVTLQPAPVLLVPGGGPLTDVVRSMDQTHRLGEEAAHWLALGALTLNAHWLQELLPGSQVLNAADKGVCCSILDAFAFAVADDRRAEALPHTWEATSDSVALRAAIVARARKLVLLKSVSVPEGTDWDEVSRQGHVDAHFPRLLQQADHLIVRVVNFRQWQPECCDASAAPGGEPCPR